MNFNKITNHIVKTLIACTATTFLTTNSSYAASYFLKVFSGNTLSSLRVQADAPFIVASGGFTQTTAHNAVTTSNLFSPGLSLGMLGSIHPKIDIGLELGLESQFQKHKFGFKIDDTGTGMLEVPNLNMELQNNYRALAAFMMQINKSVYAKAGLSMLNQDIKTSVTPSGNLNVVSNKYSKTETENMFGAIFGAGFAYNITKAFGIFTEYNYTYYPDKNIDNFIAPTNIIEPSGTFRNFHHSNRTLKLSQSVISIGFVFGV